jgi:hypothetical protein
MILLPNLFGEWKLYREWGRISKGFAGQVQASFESFDYYSRDTCGLSRCLCAIIAADLFKRCLHLAAFMSDHGMAFL